MKTIVLKLVIVIGLLGVTPLMAVDKEFIATTGDWTDANDWDPVGVPSDTDHVIILSGNTCNFSPAANDDMSHMTVESGATFNIAGGKTLFVEGNTSGTSTIEGTINLQGNNSILQIRNSNHTFATVSGNGKIVGQNAGAEIQLGQNRQLTSEIAVEGLLQMNTVINGTKFFNHGRVEANGSGVLLIAVDEIEDDASGEWKVSTSSSTLRIDQISSSTVPVLDGDFTVTAGTLDIDSPGFDTAGALVFTAGTIDCLGLTGSEDASFTGS